MSTTPTSVREGGPNLKGPLDYPSSPLRHSTRQPLMLGVFLDMQDRHISNHPTSNTWTFPTISTSRMQWLPKGGYDGEASLDAFVALGAMAAATKSILLISTIHILYGPLHPLHIAKFGATLDHISNGRWGINVVTGHREIEHQMFGWNRIEHDHRYEMAGELLDVVNSLWGETENISYEGRVSPWKLENAWVTPKPVFGRPVLVNATGSPAGIDFAVRYSDLVFITSPGGADITSALESLPEHVKGIKEKAKALGREIKVLINPVVVSKDTSEETWAYLQNIVDGMDEGSGHMKVVKSYDSDAHAWRGHKTPGKQGYKLGGNIEVIGTPKEVVEQLVALHGVGIDGVMLGFYDWRADFDHFLEKVLPLLKEAELRVD
ncbi:luciferase-like domain-containing protein [Aspergillus stella-maris]|uniref:luciferase-like domain-containing protein n=1 Tax=Aspergillus stella-maris TaxID=1810926 RepID=UPI003CCE45E6